jgi:integrase
MAMIRTAFSAKVVMRVCSSPYWRPRSDDLPRRFQALEQPCALRYRIIEQSTGREVGWINQYLDYQCLRRLADTTLRTYAHELLHFLRWWESVHHTDAVTKDTLSETTLLDYVRFQSGQERELTGATINQRLAIVDRALRVTFPDASLQAALALQTTYWQRTPMGIGKPRPALSRLRVKTAKRTIVPLSVDEVARFWSSFRNSRDLAIVGLMLLQGLRSQEVLDLTRDDLLLSEAQIRVRGKGNKTRFLPLAPEANNSWTTICGWSGQRLRATRCLSPSRDPPVVRGCLPRGCARCFDTIAGLPG